MYNNSIKVVITAPPGDFYRRIIKSLGFGFNQIGLDVYWSDQNLDDNKFHDCINKIKPKLIFEINRVLKDRALISKDIIHATWLQDYRFNGISLLDNFGCSDKFYFLINPSVWNIDKSILPSYTILSPGADSHRVSMENIGAEAIDFSFAGFIPDPLNLNHIIKCKITQNNISLGKFLSIVDITPFMQSTYSAEGMYREIDSVMNKFGIMSLGNSDLHLLDEILPRTLEREKVIDMALKISSSLELYGPKNWLNWPKFKSFYKGNIDNIIDLNNIYKKTKINIHNGGLSMHFRVLECMATKSFVVLNETLLDHMYGGILESFKPNIHFAHYNLENFSDVCSKFLRDAKARNVIADRAYSEVINSHTWMHRALQIAKDVDLPIKMQGKGRNCAIQEILN